MYLYTLHNNWKIYEKNIMYKCIIIIAKIVSTSHITNSHYYIVVLCIIIKYFMTISQGNQLIL